MATRRKKASTRVSTVQRSGGRAKVRPSKGGRGTSASPRKKKKAPSRKTSTRQATKKAPVVKKQSGRRVSSKRKTTKRRKKKKQKLTPSLVKRNQASFLRMRSNAIKAEKLVIPAFTRKKGKLRLRGANGKERSILVNQFWENIKEGWLEANVLRSFASLLSEFQQPPSLYARFTFTVKKVHTMLTAGSPKLIRATRQKIKHWFFSTGLSYNLEGARIQFERGYDTLNKTIVESAEENFGATFYLEFVTCIAYVIED